MAKRARGSVRPGQRRPIDKRPASAAPAPAPAASAAAAAPKPAGLSEAELERAAVLEADLLAQEKVAEQARQRTRTRTTREVAPAASGSLTVAARNEYAYVARDIRDIVRIASILIGILFLIWFLIDVVKVIPIGG